MATSSRGDRRDLIKTLSVIAFLILLLREQVAASQLVRRSSFMGIRGGDLTNATATARDKKKSPGWLLGSLFRLSDEAKIEASIYNPSDEVNITRQTGRGGALEKEKQHSKTQVNTPLDTSQVGTLASRLLKDENETDKSTNSTLLSDSTPLTSRLWWSTAWSAQTTLEDEAAVTTRARLLDSDATEKATQDSATEADITANKSKLISDEVAADKKNKKYKKKKKGRRKEKKTPNFDVVTKQAGPDFTVVEEQISVANHTNATSVGSEVSLTTYSQYESSGYWHAIDTSFSLGMANKYPKLRLSRNLRSVRKIAANLTGLHGLVSGKGRIVNQTLVDEQNRTMRRRVAAIERARKQINKMAASKHNASKRFGFFGKSKEKERLAFVAEGKREEIALERRRKARVQAIDREMALAQNHLKELACEKDVLQQRPNPLWNYTTKTAPLEKGSNATRILDASRHFNFPPEDLVDDYLDMLFYSGRIVKLNHTDLWRNGVMDDDDDDELASDSEFEPDTSHSRRSGSGAGTWLLRNGLGEKLGQTVETAGYKAVGKAIMGVLAQGISAIHGVNIMKHTDLRLFVEQTPELPPISAGIIPGSGKDGNYAQHALHDIMRRGAKRQGRGGIGDSDFIQKEAIVETLLSHCQISAPVLTLFPLAWQRALLGNLITLITAVVADFASGLEFTILGHRLAFSFTSITEEDMIKRMGSNGLNRRRVDPVEFEAAVKATANDLSEELRFLDRWHERVLGGGVLRAQIANLIARLVLTLVDDILADAKMDFWTSHAGGPRLMAGLEFRTTSNYMGEPTTVEN